MKKYFNVLRKCPLFERIKDEEIPGMLNCLGAKVIQVSEKQFVFMEGEPARYVGIVLSGMIQVVREDYYGNRSIVAAVEPAQLFGETFACADEERMPVSAVAECESEVLLADCRRILTTCSNACGFHNQLVSNLLKIVARKNLLLNQKIELLSQKTTREKLMTYLLAQAKRCGSNEFTIPYDRQALADYLGVERSAMSAELGKLRRDGVIECKRSWFKVLDAV